MAKIKKTLNDQNIKGLESAPAGKRYYAWDAAQPFFGVRVTDNGSKSYGVSAKLPGASNTTFLTIGKVGTIGLAAARKTAAEYLCLASEGKDPRTVEHAKDTALAKEVADDNDGRFRNVLADFLETKEGEIKNYGKMKRTLETNCLPVWGDRQFSSITAKEIADLVRSVIRSAKQKERSKTGKAAGRALLSFIKTMGVWAVSNGRATISAAQIVVPEHVVGAKVKGKRTLSADELKKVWSATRYLNAPEQQIFRMLILTGCRLNEVIQATWSETGDLRGRCWTIPAERMKGGVPHVVPLTDMMIEVLKSLKRGAEGDYIFSVTDGATPYGAPARAKKRLNELCGFSNWVTHDLRRTMRTMVSPLGIKRHIAEEMLAHVQPGVVGTYDLHEYLDEKRDGFERWNAELARIAGPQLKVVAKRAA
jgi:integrase